MSTAILVGFWLCMAALVFGIAWCALTGLRLWRALRHGLGRLLRSAEALMVEAEKLAQRGEQLADRGTQAMDAVSHLRRTLARARVLMGAWQDVSSLLAALRAFVPAK